MTTLKKYQRKGVRQIERFNGRALLADEQGLGKTIQVLAWCKKHPELRPIIVVCPAIVKWVWKSQAQKHVGIRSTILSGRKPLKTGFHSHHPLIIINYDILQYWGKYLRKLKPKVILIDESHKIKNPSAGRTKAVRKLCKKVPHVIAIGGTPLTNKPVELFPTLNILFPKKFGNFFQFARKYSHPKKRRWGWDFSKTRNLDKLHARLKRLCMIRRLKKKVMKGMPPKKRLVIPLEISNRKEYQHAEEDFIRWLSKRSYRQSRRAKKAIELVKVGHLKRLAAELKLPAVYDWIDNFLESTDEKLVVFVLHKKIMASLRERYSKISVHIDGSVSTKKRKSAIRAFRNKSRIRILFGQSDAIGVGTDGLQKVCSNGVFVEIGWTPADIGQPEDRLHRIGQKYRVHITILVARKTIEERLCKIIQHKQRILNETLDGSGDDDGNKLDIYKELLRQLRRRQR